VNVGIHQKDRDAANLYPPAFGIDCAAGEFHLHYSFPAVRGQRRCGRHLTEQKLFVDRFLPAIGGEPLLEIPLWIEETDPDQGQPQIAGFLAVIAGQNPKTAGVDRQGFVQAKFGREVGDDFLGEIGSG